MTIPSPRSVLRHATRWHLHSHVDARSNALIAANALADRRRERLEVEEYMRGYLADRAPSEEMPGAATG